MRVLFLFLSCLLTLSSWAQINSEKFKKDFQSYTQVGTSFQNPHNLKYRYVFVGGFLNEGMQYLYFRDNIKALKKAGVPQELIHKVFPFSYGGVEANGMILFEELRMLKTDSKPLIIIGHSKGAVEVFTALISNPEWTRDNVEAAFLVQGAFGGSGIADYLQGTGKPMGREMPYWARGSLAVSGSLASPLTLLVSDGLLSLTSESAASLTGKLLNTYRFSAKDIENRLYYITSSQHPSANSPVLNFAGWYLYASYGNPAYNDGLVEERLQSLPFGVRLLSLVADHAALMVSRPVSNASSTGREALMYAIMKSF